MTALKTQFTANNVEPLLPYLAEMVLSWPPEKRFPAIDIIRLAVSKVHNQVCNLKSGGLGIIDILIQGADLRPDVTRTGRDLDANTLLVLRTFVNLFEEQEGISLLTRDYKKILEAAKIGEKRSSSKPLKVAFSTLLLKYFSTISNLTSVTLFSFLQSQTRATGFYY